VSREIYDVLIVGSGATGGIAAKVLTECGLDTLLLEAGPSISRSDFLTHSFPYNFPFRGRGSPSKIRKDGALAARENTPFKGYYAELSENPYITPPNNPFDWQYRSRILGGRTLHWGRQSLRLADYDFKPASIDGQGIDWPFGYKELEPYYDKVEDYIGVQGFHENLPQIPDGKFQPAFAYNCYEHLMGKAAIKMGRRLTALRIAQLSRPHRGRPACHCCGSCGAGCDIDAFFSTPAVTLPDAMATGNLTLQTDAVVRHVMVNDEARATGVGYFNRLTKNYKEAFAKVVVLAGSTLESTRIMLNSTSRHFSTGLANSSGVLGHYLMDHTEPGTVWATLPELTGGAILNEDGKNNGSYIPRWHNLANEKPHPDFLRGYGIMVKGGAQIYPGHANKIDGFGAGYKRRIKDLHPAIIRVYPRGETLPNHDSFVEIDKNVVDAWGIPVLRINYARTDNDFKMAKQAMEDVFELVDHAGAEILHVNDKLAEPGNVAHEMGTARMGQNPRTSVLNGYNQAHDIDNLLVVDGACFPSSSCQNPTLTFMAVAWRASEHLVDRLKRGEL